MIVTRSKTRRTKIFVATTAKPIVGQRARTTISCIRYSADTSLGLLAIVASNVDGTSLTHANFLLDEIDLFQNFCHFCEILPQYSIQHPTFQENFSMVALEKYRSSFCIICFRTVHKIIQVRTEKVLRNGFITKYRSKFVRTAKVAEHKTLFAMVFPFCLDIITTCTNNIIERIEVAVLKDIHISIVQGMAGTTDFKRVFQRKERIHGSHDFRATFEKWT